MAGIEGVKRVESNSSEGFSRVGIEFKLGLDAQGSARCGKVAAIRFRLPKEIEDPTIARFDVAALPVATYAVSSTLPADKTRLLVEDGEAAAAAGGRRRRRGGERRPRARDSG